jgi:hypothetical protein
MQRSRLIQQTVVTHPVNTLHTDRSPVIANASKLAWEFHAEAIAPRA